MTTVKQNKPRLPDDAIVVRGGNSDARQIERSIYAFNVYEAGFSVVSASDKSLKYLCQYVPHSIVRCTTVSEVRKAGGDVVVTSGRSPQHATLIGMRSQRSSGYRSISDLFGSVPRNASMHEEEWSMNSPPRVFADFNNSDRLGRIRLNTVGAREDLERCSIELSDGLQLELYDDEEIVTAGVARYDPIEGWVAEVDWSAI